MHCLCAGIAGFVVLSAHIALAQATTATTDSIEVIEVYGRRLRRVPIAEVTEAATVIDRAEIERSQARLLVDVLRRQPGIDVRSLGGPGKQTTVSIRGSNADQVQVLIDGVRVDSATNGFFNWADLTAQDIESVEIIRGPQSTLYGASAMGGVIQISTRRGEGPPALSIYGGLGNLAQRNVGARLSGATSSGIRYFVSAQYDSINAVSAFLPDPTPSPSPESDAYRNSTFSAHLSVPVGAGSSAISWRYVRSHTELDNATSDNPFFDQDGRQMQLSWDTEYPLTDFWLTRLRLSQNEDRIKGRDPNLSFNNFDVESLSRQVSWVNDIDIYGIDLVAGADFELERGRNPDFGIRNDSKQTGVFAQASHAFGRLTLNAGGRYEWNSRTENQPTYQGGARLALLEGLDVLANLGTAFRPPTLNELFFQDPFVEGNPNLDPETSYGGDLGIRLDRSFEAGGSVHLELWGFFSNYRDLIEFRLGSDFILRPVNVERATTRGLETSFRIGWKSVWLSGAYTFLRARDDEGDRLRGRPDHSGRVALDGEWKRFSGEAVAHLVGRSFGRSGERDRVRGYATLDLNVAYELSRWLTLRGHVHNVIDRDYREAFNRGTLGRTYMVSLEATWSGS